MKIANLIYFSIILAQNKRVHCNLSLSAIRLEIIPCKVKVLSYQAERIL